jgi:hypothetical protein
VRTSKNSRTTYPVRLKLLPSTAVHFVAKTNVRFHIQPNTFTLPSTSPLPGKTRKKAFVWTPGPNAAPATQSYAPSLPLPTCFAVSASRSPTTVLPPQSVPSRWTDAIVPSPRSFSAINSAWPASLVAASKPSASNPTRSGPSPSDPAPPFF